LFDLPKDRLGKRFAHGIDAAARFGLELALHPLHPTGSLGDRPPLAAQWSLSVLVSLRGNIPIDPLAREVLKVF
jgi:hypothetical protein